MREVYRDIELSYERSRDRNKRELESRKQEIYFQIPRIQKIDEQIIAFGIEESKKQLLNPSKSKLKIAKDTISSLKEEKNKLLLENSYPIGYLEMQYDCAVCRDTGYIENGDRCNCFKSKISNILYKMSNMSYMLEKENFSKFDIDIFSDEIYESEKISPRENMKIILNISKDFINTFRERNEFNLLFYGPTGQGKTFMLNCIAKELLDRNVNVIYETAFSMLDTIENRKFRRDDINQTKYQMLLDCDLLIIDDLGIEFINSFSISEIFNILNSRIITGKKTLISTNLSLKELSERYTDRIFSRVFNKFSTLKFFGEDLRLKINL